VQQRKVLAALAACRTADMGGHVHRCNACGSETPLYNSCGDRHCPQCQAGNRAAWLDARRDELLPVEYFHAVFTVPHELAALAAAHPSIFYNLLFQAVRETLLEIAATPRHLGAEIGGLMVLHTWGQNLELHPHVHVIVPGGGLSPDGTKWISCAPGFFLPVRVLSRLFRGKLLAFLKWEYNRGTLTWTGGLAPLSDPVQFTRLLTAMYQKAWVVYAKAPCGGPEQVLKYLARYTYRVAISNNRIESIDAGQVTFRYKDYAHGHRCRRMTLAADEFIRRFLQQPPENRNRPGLPRTAHDAVPTAPRES
jgi:Putative transposase/Transposase zinc-binding domain